jgi:hypothetical protein
MERNSLKAKFFLLLLKGKEILSFQITHKDPTFPTYKEHFKII